MTLQDLLTRAKSAARADRQAQSAPSAPPPASRRRSGRVDLVALAACAVLALVLAAQIVLTPRADPPARAPGLAGVPPRLTRVPPPAEYPGILAAPVFAPDRKPGEAGGSGGDAGGALAAYAAVGAASGRKVATAVLAGPAGVIKTIRRGETLEGWRLVAVGKSDITFEKQGARRVLVIGAPPQAAAMNASEPAPGAP